MAGWTKKSFLELEDYSPDGSPVRWWMARDALGTSELGVSRFTFEPGARTPYGHRHREQEEVYLVVRGSGRAKLEDEWLDLVEWDVLRVSPETTRGFEAGDEGLDLVCIGGRRPAGNDSEQFADFWD